MRARLKRLFNTVTGKQGRMPPRNLYKETWSSLSKTADDAKFWVQGSTDDETLDKTANNDLERFGRHLKWDTNTDILEIGCGVGRLGKVFAPRVKSWTGCDVSPHMLEHARQRLSAFSNVRFVELSGYDLKPLADNSLDIVYCTVVFMHLSEWDRYNYIVEAHRILKPGGQLYIDNISLTTGTGWTFFESSRSIDPRSRPPQIGQTSTPQEFEVYLKKAGFSSFRVDIVDDAWVVGLGIK